MGHSYKVTDARVARDYEQDKDFLEVKVDIFLDRVVDEADLEENPELAAEGVEVGETILLPMGERAFAFKLDASKEEVNKALDKVVATLDLDAEQAEKNKESHEAQKKANETIAALKKEHGVGNAS